MKVVCIYNDNYVGMTINRTYDVGDAGDYYSFINDNGIRDFVIKERFISLEEFRETKLKELGI